MDKFERESFVAKLKDRVQFLTKQESYPEIPESFLETARRNVSTVEHLIQKVLSEYHRMP